VPVCDRRTDRRTDRQTDVQPIPITCFSIADARKKQSDQIEAIQKRVIRIIYPCAHDMPYTSAIFLADLPTMSDRRDQLARKLFKSTIHPTSSLHNLLPPPREHPSITRLRVPSKFPRIPTRTKKYQSLFSHAVSHYQTS